MERSDDIYGGNLRLKRFHENEFHGLYEYNTGVKGEIEAILFINDIGFILKGSWFEEGFYKCIIEAYGESPEGSYPDLTDDEIF